MEKNSEIFFHEAYGLEQLETREYYFFLIIFTLSGTTILFGIVQLIIGPKANGDLNQLATVNKYLEN